jgi:hypothetical protein
MFRCNAFVTGAATAALLFAFPVVGNAQQAGAERQVLTNLNLTEAQARAELAYLAPNVRAEVERRATQGNTIRGVMETMLLNSVSQLFAAQKVVAVDFVKGVVVFEGANGQVRTYPFDATLLQVKG